MNTTLPHLTAVTIYFENSNTWSFSKSGLERLSFEYIVLHILTLSVSLQVSRSCYDVPNFLFETLHAVEDISEKFSMDCSPSCESKP